MAHATTAPPLPPRNQGLACRQCGRRHFLTVYTRPRGDGIVRRKRCRNCGKAITTREKVV
jgi:transcriptional regulator NrdR family protein